MRTTLLALLALLAAPAALAAHPGPSVDLTMYYDRKASANEDAIVTYHAHADSALTTLAATVTTDGCTATPITATEASGHETGRFTLELGAKSCTFVLSVVATEGLDTATYQQSGTVEAGSSGSAAEFWIPTVFFVAALFIFLLRAKLLASAGATFGILTATWAGFPMGVVGALFVMVLSMWLEAIAGERIYERYLKGEPSAPKRIA